MTNEPESESRWLLEPPGPNEVQFQISVGEGIQVTDEIRRAIDDLIASLNMEDVVGYATCSPRCRTLANCGTKTCKPLNNCTELTVRPCLADMRCIIANIA
jgi:hypothetical protein